MAKTKPRRETKKRHLSSSRTRNKGKSNNTRVSKKSSKKRTPRERKRKTFVSRKKEKTAKSRRYGKKLSFEEQKKKREIYDKIRENGVLEKDGQWTSQVQNAQYIKLINDVIDKVKEFRTHKGYGQVFYIIETTDDPKKGTFVFYNARQERLAQLTFFHDRFLYHPTKEIQVISRTRANMIDSIFIDTPEEQYVRLKDELMDSVIDQMILLNRAFVLSTTETQHARQVWIQSKVCSDLSSNIKAQAIMLCSQLFDNQEEIQQLDSWADSFMSKENKILMLYYICEGALTEKKTEKNVFKKDWEQIKQKKLENGTCADQARSIFEFQMEVDPARFEEEKGKELYSESQRYPTYFKYKYPDIASEKPSESSEQNPEAETPNTRDCSLENLVRGTEYESALKQVREGNEKDATRAYKRLAMLLHPDKKKHECGKGPFQQLGELYANNNRKA